MDTLCFLNCDRSLPSEGVQTERILARVFVQDKQLLAGGIRWDRSGGDLEVGGTA